LASALSAVAQESERLASAVVTTLCYDGRIAPEVERQGLDINEHGGEGCIR